jgi:GPI-anchored cell wall organization protein
VSAAQCDGPITIQNQGDATALASCSTIKGDVEIDSSVAGTLELNGVQQITGDLTCLNATQLTSLSADRLGTIGGKFRLEELQILSTLAFNGLSEVLTIQWIALPALQSLAFTRGVSKVENILISNTGLTSLNGLELETVGLMDINNNRYLDTVDVNNMANVTSAITFSANSKTLEIKLPNLEFAANMTFRNVSNVDLPSLNFVNGSIGFFSNTFESISLPNLTKTGQALVFQDGIGLSNISVPMITEVGAALNINNNPDLKKIDGFPKLEVVVGALDFSGDFNE